MRIEVDKAWTRHVLPDGQGDLLLKGYLHAPDINMLLAKAASLDEAHCAEFLRSLDGHFALIIRRPGWVLAAVDKVASTPLFYLCQDGAWRLDCSAARLVEQAELTAEDINPDAALAIAMSGYTLGATTLYHRLQTLAAGEAAIFDDGSEPQKFRYYRYAAWQVVDGDYPQYLAELSEVTLHVLRKMLSSIGDREIVIPLSAGNDSRLIASGLKHLGVRNVKCFTYGIPGNFEADISRQIAEKLGYAWRFVPLTLKNEKAFYSTPEFQCYWREADTAMAAPYYQGLSANRYLRESGWISDDAVFVNGNTGDFISGGHVPKAMCCLPEESSEQQRMALLLDEFVKKHFSLWECLKTPENLENIKKQLRAEIAQLHAENIPATALHGVYEYLELLGRQSKYIIATQHTYEFYGYEWRMPLWDDDYLLFWAKVPLEMKAGQRLYKNMLKQQNWGGVWDNIMPVNRQTIRPKWLIPLRFSVKCCFAPFGGKGRAAWKRFERSVFYYWRDVGMTVALFPYSRFLFERGGPRHVVAFMAEHYLAEKGAITASVASDGKI